jgi:hypothetical protein
VKLTVPWQITRRQSKSAGHESAGQEVRRASRGGGALKREKARGRRRKKHRQLHISLEPKTTGGSTWLGWGQGHIWVRRWGEGQGLHTLLGIRLSVRCVFSRLARSSALEPRHRSPPSRSRKKLRQLLRHLHPRRPHLQRLRVGSNQWWHASQRCSGIQRRRAAFQVWSISALLLIATARL